MRFPPDDMQERLRMAQRATAKPATPARRAGGVDNGTVALAISGMTYYWLMPMMAGRRRKRRGPDADQPNTSADHRG